MKNSQIDASLVLFLQDEIERENKERSLAMQGKIRPRQKCPACHSSFTLVSARLGFACTKGHPVQRPQSYMLDLWHGARKRKSRKRIRIYCDKLGSTLTSYDAAIKVQESVTAEINNNTFRPDDYTRADSQEYSLGNGYDEWAKRADKINTVNMYEEAKKAIFKHFTFIRDMRTIGTRDVYRFFSSMDDRGESMRDKIVTCLIACLNYHRKNGCAGQELSTPQAVLDARIKIKEKRKKNKKIPSIEEAISILVQLLPLERLACFTMGCHGRRPGEIMALQKKHFDFTAHTFTLVQHVVEGQMQGGTKELDEETCHIHEQLYDELCALCEQHDDDDYIFSEDPSTPGNWTKLAEQIKKLTVSAGLTCPPYQVVKHAFVSSVAVKAGDKGAGRDLTQHESEESTLNYIDELPVTLQQQRNAQKLISIPKDSLPGFAKR